MSWFLNKVLDRHCPRRKATQRSAFPRDVYRAQKRNAEKCEQFAQGFMQELPQGVSSQFGLGKCLPRPMHYFLLRASERQMAMRPGAHRCVACWGCFLSSA
uniref:YqzE family protein n=1 Tax=Ascaris lumbricoides TaxID=6252 RepID=A0A0M3HTT4_ASCLU